MQNIPLSVPNFEGNEMKYVTTAVKEGWVSTGGKYISLLENKMAEFLNVKKTVAVQSGTSAIHLALVNSNIGPGDGVFVPTITFIAAVNPVKYQFAKPIFIDCDDSLCLNPKKLRNYCESNCQMVNGVLVDNVTKTPIKAIIVVHVFGNMADMEQIMEISEKYHLIVIEDATEALGTKYENGRYKENYAGTIGDYGAFSFNGNKIITTGGGGMVVARNLQNAEHIQYLSTQAKDDQLYYHHNEIGYNYRMTNVQAAIGLAQSEELDEFIQRKQSNYLYYKSLLKTVSKARLMSYRNGVSSNSWFYALWIDIENITLSVKELVEELGRRGICTRPIWELIADQKPYLQDQRTDLDVANYYVKHVINIPCSTNISKSEMDYVVKELEQVLNEVSI